MTNTVCQPSAVQAALPKTALRRKRGSCEERNKGAICQGDKMTFENMKWTREPADYLIRPDRIEITTMPHTDLWQRTYYHFRNDNAPVLQLETEERYFSFIVKTDFAESCHRFDQCGIVMYLDSENWLKGSVEYENESSSISAPW